jgi:cytidine deaminase
MPQEFETYDLDRLSRLMDYFQERRVQLPKHSNFLVAAAIYCTDEKGDQIVQYGINSETCNLENSFCAERTALVSLKSQHTLFEIKSVYIVATSHDAVTPGALCREMLIENVESPSQCRVITVGENFLSSNPSSFLVTSLDQLFPFPCIFRNKDRTILKDIGSSYHKQPIREFLERATTNTVNIDILDMYFKMVALANIPDGKLYPINYVAGVLFSDSSIAISRSDKLLEFGCSLDAISKLAYQIEQKGIIRPVYLLLCDQYGNLHAPFSKNRAWLLEKGFGDVKILIHSGPLGSIEVVEASSLLPLAPVQILDSLTAYSDPGGRRE